MRDITWQMFELTGDIDAYLLYRACDTNGDGIPDDMCLETDGGSDGELEVPLS